MARWELRPEYKGRPVPFVARYPGERTGTVAEESNPRFERKLSPFTGRIAWVLEIDGWYRDQYGWLWQPEPFEDPTGRPEFGQLHADRQRKCMDELLCQVCGGKVLDPRTHVTTWLVAEVDFERARSRNREKILTSHAPVCRECIPVSLRFCPHLRDFPWRALEVPVVSVGAYGVIGDVRAYPLGEMQYQGVVPPHARDEMAARTIARQRVVALRDWREFKP